MRSGIVKTTLRIMLIVAACLVDPRAFALEFSFIVDLSGEFMDPPNSSYGGGYAIVNIDRDLQTMRIRVRFEDLDAGATAVNIHGLTEVLGEGVAMSATAVPSLPGLPAGLVTGFYDQTFAFNAAATFNPEFLDFDRKNAPTLLLNGMLGGKSYISISSTAYPDGELRGFLYNDPKADFDHSGLVANGDLNLLRGAFGVGHDGDANDDGLTDGSDALIWQQQLGSHALLADGAGGSHHGHEYAAVPEPAGEALLAALTAALVGAARRRPRSRQRRVFASSTTRLTQFASSGR